MKWVASMDSTFNTSKKGGTLWTVQAHDLASNVCLELGNVVVH